MKFCKMILALALLTLLVASAAGQEKHPPNQPTGGNAPSGVAPQMVIESFTHDFGEVKAGTPLRYAFKVKNLGKGDLLINSVSPG